MKPQDAIPTLQATAAMMLPGKKHARSLLDVSIRVLEYFAKHAAHDAATGTAAVFPKPEQKLLDEVENVNRLLSAFGRLHGRSH